MSSNRRGGIKLQNRTIAAPALAWQWLNVPMGIVMPSAVATVIFVWKYGAFYFPSQKDIVNKIFSTGSSLHPQLRDSGHTCTHVCQWRRIASKRRTGWSKKLLDIFEWIILLRVYMIVDVKYSRRGGTKVWVWLKWSSVATGTVSQPSVAIVTLCSNGLGEVIGARCYYDRACLAETKRTNRRGDDIGPLLLWPSSTSHRKIYDINNKVI
jgi:hypothetical protein